MNYKYIDLENVNEVVKCVKDAMEYISTDRLINLDYCKIRVDVLEKLLDAYKLMSDEAHMNTEQDEHATESENHVVHETEMEEHVIYKDANGFQYVKGNLGGGYTIYWDGGYYDMCKLKVWDYCTEFTEKQIIRFCRKTDERFID